MATVVGTNGREVLLEKDGRILRRNRSQIHVAAYQSPSREGSVNPVQLPIRDAVAPDQYSHAVAFNQSAANSQSGVITPPARSEHESGSIDSNCSQSAVAPIQSESAVAPSSEGSVVFHTSAGSAVASTCAGNAGALPVIGSAVAVPGTGGVVASPSLGSAIAPKSRSKSVVTLSKPTSSNEMSVPVKSTRSGRAVKGPNRLNL